MDALETITARVAEMEREFSAESLSDRLQALRMKEIRDTFEALQMSEGQ